jgi:hypothetical protein
MAVTCFSQQTERVVTQINETEKSTENTIYLVCGPEILLKRFGESGTTMA